MKTKVIVLTIFLVLLVGVLLFVLIQKKHGQVGTGGGFESKTAIDSSKLPDIIPSDFPFEAGAYVPQNFVSSSRDGKSTIAERWFVTSKSLDENFYTYLGYLQKHGWQIKTNVNQVGLKILGASKGALTTKVEMSENTQTKTKTVKISFYQEIRHE